jgi:uncharacterized phage-associated protein
VELSANRMIDQACAPYDARAVANFFLDLADRNLVALTQMSLLKLIYFAHGWHLAKCDGPLVRQHFEAWEYGPVIKIVRDEFLQFGDEAITGRATRFNLLQGQRSLVYPRLAEEDQAFVSTIFAAYHGYSAWQLSDLTHEAGSPWDRLWNCHAPIGRLALRIRNDDIRDHFAGISQRLNLC